MPAKITKQYTGGGQDVSVPEEALERLKALGVGEEICQKIGKLLGQYRAQAQYHATAPTPATALRHVEQTKSAITRLLEHIDLMPADVKALGTEALQRLSGKDYEPFTDRMTLDLQRYAVALHRAADDMRAWPSLSGEKRKNLEHKLLSEVAALLHPSFVSGLEDAAGTASEILRQAGIRVLPVDKKKARAAILAYQKI